MSRVRLQRNEAIVLKRRDFGEADRILTLYTRERGKVSAIAKGVRRITSRLGGHVELFTHGQMLLAQGRNLDVLTQADTIQTFRGLREDLIRTTYAYHAAELVDRFSEEGMAAEAIFDLLRDCLDGLCDAEDPALVLRFFELRLLGLLGYRPQFFQCVACGETLEPAGNAFDAEAGGVLCPGCAQRAPTAIPLSESAFRVLRFLQTRSLATARQVALQQATRAELERIMHAYVRHILERDLRSVEFLERLRRMTPAAAHASTPTRTAAQTSTRTSTRTSASSSQTSSAATSASSLDSISDPTPTDPTEPIDPTDPTGETNP